MSRCCILVVVEHREVISVLSHALAEFGDVVACGDPQLANQQLSSRHFELAIVDCRSAAFDLNLILRRLRGEESRSPNLPLLVICDEPFDPGSHSSSDELGVVVATRYDLEEIRLRVRSLLSERSFTSSAVVDAGSCSAMSHRDPAWICHAVAVSSEAFCILDGHGNVVYINQAFVDRTGRDLADLQTGTGLGVLFKTPAKWNGLWQVCRDGSPWKGELELLLDRDKCIYLEVSADPLSDKKDRFDGVVVTLRDISSQKRSEEELRYFATHDALTKVFNRRHFEELLARVVSEAGVPYPSALLYLDIDHFKMINDFAGHAAGDRILVDFSALIQEQLKDEDYFARFGGDEFTVLLPGRGQEEATVVAQNLIQSLGRRQIGEAGRRFSTSISVGLARIDGSCSPREVLRRADMACKSAKIRGRNQMVPYTEAWDSMDRHLDWRQAAEMAKEALDKNRVEIWLQPVYAFDAACEPFYEIFAREHHRLDGDRYYQRYLSEESDWSLRLLPDMLLTLCSLEFARGFSNHTLSVNVQERLIREGWLAQVAAKLNLGTQRIVFEISEEVLLRNLTAAISQLEQLKNSGCTIAVDGVGAQASSLMYLKELPADILKIEEKYVEGLSLSAVKREVLESIQKTAATLGLKTAAVGVADEADLRVVREMGIHYGQGLLLRKPCPSSTFLSQEVEGQFVL